MVGQVRDLKRPDQAAELFEKCLVLEAQQLSQLHKRSQHSLKEMDSSISDDDLNKPAHRGLDFSLRSSTSISSWFAEDDSGCCPARCSRGFIGERLEIASCSRVLPPNEASRSINSIQ